MMEAGRSGGQHRDSESGRGSDLGAYEGGMFSKEVSHRRVRLGLGELKNLDNIMMAEGGGGGLQAVYRKSVCLDAFNSWQLLSFV